MTISGVLLHTIPSRSSVVRLITHSFGSWMRRRYQAETYSHLQSVQQHVAFGRVGPYVGCVVLNLSIYGEIAAGEVACIGSIWPSFIRGYSESHCRRT